MPGAHLLSPRDCAALELTLGDLDLRAFSDLFFGPLNTCPWSWRRSFGGGRLHLGVVDARLALAVVPCVATEALAILFSTYVASKQGFEVVKEIRLYSLPFGEQQGPTLGAAPSGSHCPLQ